MSMYSDISKEIGIDYKRPNEPFPTRDEMIYVRTMAGLGNRQAFKKILTWIRYCPAPKTEDEHEIIGQVLKLYTDFQKKFLEK